jgi:hypothetical protein
VRRSHRLLPVVDGVDDELVSWATSIWDLMSLRTRC